MADPGTLPFLDAPPAAALGEARALLRDLDALDEDGRLTPTGRRLRALPLPPRLARMVTEAARQGRAREASEVAALLAERGLGGDGVDLGERLERFRRDPSSRATQTRRLAAGWAGLAPGHGHGPPPMGGSIGALVALAYPDRIARMRGAPGEYVLANGRGARLEPHDPLARHPFLVVADMAGTAAASRILAAAAIAPAEIEAVAGGRIVSREEVVFEPTARALRARAARRLGAVTLADHPVPVPPDAASAAILARGIADLGLAALPWSDASRQWRDRVMFLRGSRGDEWPDLSDGALARDVETWLAPHLVGRTGLADLGPGDLATALAELLPWTLRARLDHEAPTHVVVPTGSRIAVDYAQESGPALAVRVQELFGLAQHPALADGRVPLVLHLLSPAGRPIQVTRDLAVFWRGSWAEVRREMRGRYPKHPWPEDPASAEPTRRAKPRGT